MATLSHPDQIPEVLRLLDQAYTNRVTLDTETTGIDSFGLRDRRTGAKQPDGTHKGPLIPEEVAQFGPAKIAGMSLGVPLDTREFRTFYLPTRHESAEPQLPVDALRCVVQHIERRRMTIVGHNLKFDMKMLQADQMMPDDRLVKIEDTMILEHLLNAEEEYAHYALDSMSEKYIGHDTAWKRWVRDEFRDRHYRRFSQFQVAEMAPYSEDDCWMSWGLRQFLFPKLRSPNPPWYGGSWDAEKGELVPGPELEEVFQSDMQLLWVLLRMETRGMKIDRPKTEEIIVALTKQVGILQEELAEIAGREINVGSSTQLFDLWTERGWPLAHTKQPCAHCGGIPGGCSKCDHTGLRRTFADVALTPLTRDSTDEAFKTFVDVKGQYLTTQKVKGTYYEGYLRLMDEDGIVHPDFIENGTVTGRLSCRQPNFQNVPRRFSLSVRGKLTREEGSLVQSEVRSVFVPRSEEFRLVGRDYNQQEMRMFLHYANEPSMRKVIADGGDIHHFAAETLFGEPMPPKFDADGKETKEYKRRRALAKTINFGILYGMGPKKLSEAMAIPYDQALRFYQNYLNGFPGIPAFMKRVTEVANARMFIRNAFGRRYRFRALTPQERSQGWVMGNLGPIRINRTDRAVTHTALNYLIQGSCGDLSRRAMIRVDDLLRGTRSALVNVIHDEMLYELHVDEEKALLPEIEHAMCEWPDKNFALPFTASVKRSEWAWADAKEL